MTKDFKGQYLMTCIERRSVTSPFHDHNLHSRTIEENYELLFCSWVKSCTGKPYMSNFSLFFFCHICRTTFVNIQKFRYHGNVTKRLLFTVGKKIKIKTYKLNRSIWFYASTMSRILSRENDDSVGLRYLTKGCSCGLSRLTGLARLTKNFFCKKFNMSIWI